VIRQPDQGHANYSGEGQDQNAGNSYAWLPGHQLRECVRSFVESFNNGTEHLRPYSEPKNMLDHTSHADSGETDQKHEGKKQVCRVPINADAAKACGKIDAESDKKEQVLLRRNGIGGKDVGLKGE